MASAQKRGATWYAKYRNSRGKRVRVKTTTRTKKECQVLAHELEADAERQRHGLAPLRKPCTTILGDASDRWLKNRCPAASAGKERCRLEKHIINQPIGKILLSEVTPAVFDTRLREMEAAGASAGSVNKLRAIMRAVIAAAIDAESWDGPNPIDRVKPRRVQQQIYETLRTHEVPKVLEAAGPRRNMMAVALYLALRKGELFALRKTDVRLEDRVLYVRRSHARNTVKGGKAVALPIATPLVPYLQSALDESDSEFVFPGPDGKQLPEHTPMEKIFRRNLTRAGLITGWKHSCRRCAARKDPTVEKHPDYKLRPCPKCGAKMWPSPIPRQMRFHDCRHTTITLLLQLGVAPQFVQRIARHANIRTTLETYGHLNIDDLRAPLETLGKATAAPDKRVPAQLPAQAVANLGPGGVQAEQKPKNRRPGPRVETVENRALEVGAEHRVRTGDLRLGKATLYQLS